LKCDAFVVVPRDEVRQQRCFYCLKESSDQSNPLNRCSNCKCVRYCGIQCQRKDWEDHKLECSSIQKIKPHNPTQSILLISRLIRKREKLKGKKITENQKNYINNYSQIKKKDKEIDGLENHLKDQSQSQLEIFAQMSRLVAEFLSPQESKSIEASDLLKLFSMVTNEI